MEIFICTIWNGKSCLVNQVAGQNPFQTELFQWADIGSFIENAIPNWPSQSRLKSIFNWHNDKLLLELINSNDFQYTLDSGPSSPHVLSQMEGSYVELFSPIDNLYCQNLW